MAAQSRPTLILTRPEPAARRFATQVQARFGERAPDILISPLMEPEFLAPALAPLPWGGVIFTSETGVEGLARLTPDRDAPAYCVGPRTAEAARAAGWAAQDMGGDAARLVPRLVDMQPSGLLVHARGADVAVDIAGALAAHGLSVAEAMVYSQTARDLSAKARATLTGTAPVILAAFSPRSARMIVAQAAGASAPVWCVAISSAAAQALTPANACKTQVASEPNVSGMLDSLAYLLDTT